MREINPCREGQSKPIRIPVKSVREIIEKAPDLIEKLQSENHEIRDQAVTESKEIIKTVKGENLQKAILYTILFIAALFGIAALIFTFIHGGILAALAPSILGGIAAGLSACVGIYILIQYLMFVWQHRNEKDSEIAKNAPHEKMAFEPGFIDVNAAII